MEHAPWYILIALTSWAVIKMIRRPEGEVHKQIRLNQYRWRQEQWGMVV